MPERPTGLPELDAVAAELVSRARAEDRPGRRVPLRALGRALTVAASALLAAALIGALVLATAHRPDATPPGGNGTRPANVPVPLQRGIDPRVARDFAVFRRPQRPGDVPARGDLHLGLPHARGRVAYGVDRALARKVGSTAGGGPVYAIPGRGYVCLTGAGCADIASAARGKGPVGFAQCGGATGSAQVQIYALLPDRAQRVRIRQRDGREVPVAVHDNALLALLPAVSASVTPTTIVWDGPLGHDATTLGGVAAGLRCGGRGRGASRALPGRARSGASTRRSRRSQRPAAASWCARWPAWRRGSAPAPRGRRPRA